MKSKLEGPPSEIESQENPHPHLTREQEEELFRIKNNPHTKREQVDDIHKGKLLEKLSLPSKNTEGNAVIIHHEGIEDELDIIHIQAIEEKAKRVKRVVTNITDFVPVVGSIKMILEGLKGKQYGTEKEIKGMGRFIHTTSGIVFLALDLTGVGAIASEVGKGVIKIGERALVRSAEEALAREVVEKEATKLIVRGEKRIDEKEKITTT